jgi:cytochrome c peroxidase
MDVMKTCFFLLLILAVIHFVLGISYAAPEVHSVKIAGEQVQLHQYSEKEISLLRSLWLGSLPPLPKDPSNRVSDNPKAVEFGEKLFADTRFSSNGKISCKTCHKPEITFTDNEPLAIGIGTSTRRNMPIIGLAYFKWFFWDGRADSLWAQALGPFENPVEHGITRCMAVHLIAKHYRGEYEELFSPLPELSIANCPPEASPVTDDPTAVKLWAAIKPADRKAVNLVFSNIGKAIAAYVRLIVPTPSRFDLYVESLLKEDTRTMATLLSDEETQGMRLFIGQGNCIKCHSGPLFSDGDFHNVNVPGRLDRGRADGIDKVLADEFNCLGKYSDAEPEERVALNTMDTEKEKYLDAFKTPILRNVVERSPYMHAGQFKTIAKVMAFYQYPFDLNLMAEFGHSTLLDKELEKIEAFLHTLSSPLSIP